MPGACRVLKNEKVWRKISPRPPPGPGDLSCQALFFFFFCGRLPLHGKEKLLFVLFTCAMETAEAFESEFRLLADQLQMGCEG